MFQGAYDSSLSMYKFSALKSKICMQDIVMNYIFYLRSYFFWIVNLRVNYQRPMN